jgi:hypothetical protein
MPLNSASTTNIHNKTHGLKLKEVNQWHQATLYNYTYFFPEDVQLSDKFCSILDDGSYNTKSVIASTVLDNNITSKHKKSG